MDGQDVAVIPSAEAVPAPAGSERAAQAETDAQVIALWLHGRSPHTARAYGADVHAFLAHNGKPLRAVTVGDVQAFGG